MCDTIRYTYIILQRTKIMKEDKKDNKSWYEKLNILIGIIVGIFSILGIRVFKDGFIIESEINVQSLFDQEDTSQQGGISENNPQLKGTDVKVKDGSSQDKKEEIEYVASENINVETEEQVLININVEVLNIQEKYYSLPAPENLPEPTSNAPVYRYHDTNGLTMIKVASGYKDFIYSRIYYFDEDGKLYFAFIFDKLKENRLYFKDDTIIRYIDEAGITYDLYNNLDTCEWEELTIKESYEIFNNLNQ